MIWALTLGAFGFGAGCAETPRVGADLYLRLQSGDHNTRVQAVIEAGRRRDKKAVPYLVDRLEDDDVDVRLFSVQALRDITGENFDYRYYGDERSRRAGVQRWRQWLMTSYPGSAIGRRDVGRE